MAQVASDALSVVKRYVAELEKRGFSLQSAVLFGSHARGGAHEWSDIDVALVCERFEGYCLDDRDKIRRITLDVDYRLEPYPYRPEDFTEDDLFVREILATGVRVK